MVCPTIKDIFKIDETSGVFRCTKYPQFLVTSISTWGDPWQLGSWAQISPRFWAQVLDSIPYWTVRWSAGMAMKCFKSDESCGTTTFNQRHLVYLNRLVLSYEGRPYHRILSMKGSHLTASIFLSSSTSSTCHDPNVRGAIQIALFNHVNENHASHWCMCILTGWEGNEWKWYVKKKKMLTFIAVAVTQCWLTPLTPISQNMQISLVCSAQWLWIMKEQCDQI